MHFIHTKRKHSNHCIEFYNGMAVVINITIISTIPIVHVDEVTIKKIIGVIGVIGGRPFVRRGECYAPRRRRPIMFHRARSSAIAFALVLTSLVAGVALYAQQQAAEAPAAARKTKLKRTIVLFISSDI